MEPYDDQEAVIVEGLVDEWLEVLQTKNTTNQLAMSAMVRFAAFMILNHNKGDIASSLDDFDNIGAPIIQKYIQCAEDWIGKRSDLN